MNSIKKLEILYLKKQSSLVELLFKIKLLNLKIRSFQKEVVNVIKDVINFTVLVLRTTESVLQYANVLIAKMIKSILIVKKHFKYTIIYQEKSLKYALITKNRKI